LIEAHQHCRTGADFGGLGFASDHAFDAEEIAEVLFFISAYLEALNYQDRSISAPAPLQSRPTGRRGMTLAEKIFAAHDVSHRGEVKPGDVIRLDVDWVIASELSWSGMEKTYEALGEPGIFRNDRLWLAGDHVVDPRVMNHPRIKPLIESSEKARKIFKLTEYQGMNYTIMHTEFCRERAQPGMLVIGSDSHTCSAGSVSCLAIGLGVADVTLPLVTGETWIKVPDTVEICFINKPRPGLGGKDIILYVLKELKRNTVAAERVVEYTGPGLQYLSCDARFAFCNMATVCRNQTVFGSADRH
jgi:homoaconitase/3-isopropylmalate dehydratase large subunit